MVVKDHIVYRIIPFEAEVKVGDRALPSKWKALGDYKKRQEETLEKHRPNGFPRRDNCLYVCFSKENAYEWAYIMYGRQNTPYKLLTLEVTGDLYWFMSDCFNLLGDKFTHEKLDKACRDYWNSMTENRNNLILDKGYEGLFVGEAIVKAIEYKNYINGESKDVE
jgi:hypothetical protein